MNSIVISSYKPVDIRVTNCNHCTFLTVDFLIRTGHYTLSVERYMINLDQYVQKVWKADTTEAKREAMKELLAVSHATALTKANALRVANSLSGKKLDSFATNYAFSGYGMKVK